MSEYQYVEHEFAPVYNEESQVLVLGQSAIGEIQRAGLLLWTSEKPFLEGSGSCTWCTGTLDDRREKTDAACRSCGGL